MSVKCRFNACDELAMTNSTKCYFHRSRGHCSVHGCKNQVFARHLCVRHGGRPLCSFEGCYGNARLRGFCSKHGAKVAKKLCSEQGCTKMVQSKQKCVRHGGGRQCRMEGCTTYARLGGFCSRHHRLREDLAAQTALEPLANQSPAIVFHEPAPVHLACDSHSPLYFHNEQPLQHLVTETRWWQPVDMTYGGYGMTDGHHRTMVLDSHRYDQARDPAGWTFSV
ncbi:hypothetical protein ACHHYP_09558 [Achlya hypogyna]|uniref:WRKY19-like zinc finger domain-containing protein n=1 Tax=Achlya hypogyna TaxID=1202772 RepID=A0A1V9YMY6_ACHHY|nr:hypothetical protein ACHHYP_09558 [Achlya hypogyna]